MMKRAFSASILVLGLVACSAASNDDATGVGAGADTEGDSTGAAAAPSEAGTTSDGPPTRQACTSKFGSALSSTHGRLDGYLIAVVAPGSTKSCNDDTSHVHLQVEMNGGIYDVAVNADSGFIATKDVPLPGGAWSEGWHTSAPLDYVNTLGVHTADFTTGSLSQIAQQIEQALTTANHISIFATGYNANGIHDVHREGSNKDGAIAIDPLSPNAHLILFHFSDQSF